MEAGGLLGPDTGGLLLVLLGAGLSLGLVGFVLFGGAAERRTDRRIRELAGRLSGKGGEAAMVLRRRDADSSIQGLDRMLKRWVPRREALRDRLARTGHRIGILHYLLASIVLAIVPAVLIGAVFKLAPALAVLGGLAIGIGVPHMLVGSLAARRIKAFIGLFPEAIDLIVRGLKSGLPVTESIATVAAEIADPVGGEFRRIDQAMKLGQAMEEALWAASRRIGSPEFNFFVISLSVQRETGGNLAETLENLSEILRKRRQMRLKIKAMSSEARASAMIIGSLPFLMFAILMVLNAAYVLQLFHDPRGLLMVGAGLGSLGLGVLVMAKMVRFEI